MSGFADVPLAKGLSAVVDPLIPGIIDGSGSKLLDQATLQKTGKILNTDNER